MRGVVFLTIALGITACIVKQKVQVDRATVESLSFSWAVSATSKGVIAYMHVETIEDQDEIKIIGQLVPTVKGEGMITKQPPRTYTTDRNYKLAEGKDYNGITLPIRLSWVASERGKGIAKIQSIVGMVSENEQALLQLADSMYEQFSKLHIAAADKYRFDNLDTQVEIKFAGKKFYDRDKVSREIAKRPAELQSKKISHKKRIAGVQLDEQILTAADEAYQTVLDMLQSPPSSYLQELTLNFDASAAADADFRELAEGLAYLKLARILLARELQRHYEPFVMPFYYEIGDTKENLQITGITDDRKDDDYHFRYRMRTTSKKQSNEFTLGEISFDHAFKPKRMWMSLRPRGGGFVNRAAKLTFTHCADMQQIAQACPLPPRDMLN